MPTRRTDCTGTFIGSTLSTMNPVLKSFIFYLRTILNYDGHESGMGWAMAHGILPSACCHFFQKKETNSSALVEALQTFLPRGQGILEVSAGRSRKGRCRTVCWCVFEATLQNQITKLV